MIKAVFFDMDGTLVAYPPGEIPLSAQKAIARLREAGILICAATGRHRLEMETSEFLGAVSFDAVASLNGQYVYAGEQDLLANTLSPQDLETYFSRYNAPCIVSEKRRMYINYHTDDFEQAQKGIASVLPPQGELTDIAQREILQLQVYCDEDVAQDLNRDLQSVKTVRWSQDFVDLIPQSGGKTKGIEAILKHFALDWSEVMAFGDGENDLAMLSAAQIAVAMGDADANVQAVADYVTAPATQDGIAAALERFAAEFERKL